MHIAFPNLQNANISAARKAILLAEFTLTALTPDKVLRPSGSAAERNAFGE